MKYSKKERHCLELSVSEFTNLFDLCATFLKHPTSFTGLSTEKRAELINTAGAFIKEIKQRNIITNNNGTG
jgi:hypothetical protein